jgi:DNA-binding XRE family transcriptional regulator
MLTVICPRCDGAKSAFGVRCSDRGCQTGSWACDFCKGEGQVSSETAERWRKGRAMHDARVKLGMTQREEANRLGISWIQLNDIEHGRLSLEQVSKRLD